MPAWATATDWLTANRDALVVAAGAGLLAVLAWTVRRAIRGGRPDRWVDALALFLTLAWSAEGMWEVATGDLHLGTAFAVPALLLFESLLVSAMLRAARHQRLHGNPGKHGRAAWVIASAAAAVVSLAGDSPAEVALRIAVPLLAVYQWWLGLTADGTTEELGRTSWRWTPRRLLLWAGAIEPGDRDALTIDRDRLVGRMTRLEYRRRAGGWLTTHRTARLARLSLDADDDVVAQVRRRVSRSTWFTTEPAAGPVREPVSQPDPEPATEPLDRSTAEPVHDPGPEPVQSPDLRVELVHGPPLVQQLSSEQRVKKAHAENPGATNDDLVQATGLSLSTVKRYRPARTNGRAVALNRPARSES